MPRLSIIVAYAANRVIGRDNRLPWRLPGDLAHFKRTTMGRPVVMGRRTWESIGRPLPGRRNVVLSRDRMWNADGAERAGSLDDALALCVDADEAFVIGGAEVYEQALPHTHRVVATEIGRDYEGDAWFPPLDSTWREVARDVHPAVDATPTYAFVEYFRS